MTRSRKRKLARTRAKWASMHLASALLAGGGIAHAGETANELEEVVVTAQKRSEDLQKVPISLTVLGEEKLQQLQVSSFDDYAKFLPSVSFQSLGPSQAQLYFRGISTGADGLHAGSLPATGVYLDETPVTTIGSSLDLHVYDIARVEALAGPQGTLYGASSLSGTLRIITNKPNPNQFEGGYDLKATKFGRGTGGGGIEGFVNIPLIADKLAIRLVGYYEHDGGYINNVNGGPRTYLRYLPDDPIGTIDPRPPEDIGRDNPVTFPGAQSLSHYNETDSYGGRAALKFDLNDQWSITPAVIYQHQDAPGNFSYDPALGDLNVSDKKLGVNIDHWYQSALTVEGKIGNWDVVYSGGWFERTIDNTVDYTGYTVAYDQFAQSYGVNYTHFVDAAGNPVDPSQYTKNHDKYTKLNQELRFNSPQDFRLRGTAGVFYQRQTDNIRAEFDVDGLPPAFEVPGQPNVIYLSQQNRADRDYAVFTDLTFDVTSALKVSAGIREFWVKNTLDGFFGYGSFPIVYPPGAIPDPNGAIAGTGAVHNKSGEQICFSPVSYTSNAPCQNTAKKVIEHGETHKISVTYQFTPDLMSYFTWSTGFRPGGNNRLPAAGSFNADQLKSFELGWKTVWFDHRVRWNGAAFYEKWFGAQESVQGESGITSIYNAGNARVEGVETDVSWLIGEHLTLSAAGTGLLKMETTTDFCGPLRSGEHVDSCPPPVPIASYAGTQLPVTPKVKVNGTARYGFNVGNYNSFVQGSVLHQSSTTFGLESHPNSLVGPTPAFTTFDFSLGTAISNWHIEAYIENAFDKRGELGRVSQCGADYCYSHPRIYPIKPQNFGIKFGQKF